MGKFPDPPIIAVAALEAAIDEVAVVEHVAQQTAKAAAAGAGQAGFNRSLLQLDIAFCARSRALLAAAAIANRDGRRRRTAHAGAGTRRTGRA